MPRVTWLCSGLQYLHTHATSWLNKSNNNKAVCSMSIPNSIFTSVSISGLPTHCQARKTGTLFDTGRVFCSFSNAYSNFCYMSKGCKLPGPQALGSHVNQSSLKTHNWSRAVNASTKLTSTSHLNLCGCRNLTARFLLVTPIMLWSLDVTLLSSALYLVNLHLYKAGTRRSEL